MGILIVTASACQHVIYLLRLKLKILLLELLRNDSFSKLAMIGADGGVKKNGKPLKENAVLRQLRML